MAVSYKYSSRYVSHDIIWSPTYLLNGELLSSHFRHLGNSVNVLVQSHLKTLSKCQGRLWLDLDS